MQACWGKGQRAAAPCWVGALLCLELLAWHSGLCKGELWCGVLCHGMLWCAALRHAVVRFVYHRRHYILRCNMACCEVACRGTVPWVTTL